MVDGACRMLDVGCQMLEMEMPDVVELLVGL